jgi:hypothetical protein
VTSLAAAVASLASGVQWAAIGSGAVTGDVTKLAAGVALLGLSLAVTGKVVGSTALVAHGSTTAKASTGTGEATTRSTSTTADGSGTWSRAVTLEDNQFRSARLARLSSGHLPRDVQLDRKSSTDRREDHRSNEESGNQPERDRDPGSGSIAWLLFLH